MAKITKMTIQLDIFESQEKRDAGIAKSVNNANRKNEYWSLQAYYFLLQYIRTHNEFMAEEVRAASVGSVPQPPNNRAWGSVFVRAKRSGKIKWKDYKPVTNPKAHCTPATLWEVIN